MVEEEFVNPVHSRIKGITKKIEKSIEKLCLEFHENTPDPKEFEFGAIGFTAGIAKEQSRYQIAYREEQKKLEKYKQQHAKILHVVRSYYQKNLSVVDHDTAVRYGYLDGVMNCSGIKLDKDLAYYVQADELYQLTTLMLATQQRLVDTYKDIDSKLIERGRQYKTAMELMRFTNGG